jgi:hypothetical protein
MTAVLPEWGLLLTVVTSDRSRNRHGVGVGAASGLALPIESDPSSWVGQVGDRTPYYLTTCAFAVRRLPITGLVRLSSPRRPLGVEG